MSKGIQVGEALTVVESCPFEGLRMLGGMAALQDDLPLARQGVRVEIHPLNHPQLPPPLLLVRLSLAVE